MEQVLFFNKTGYDFIRKGLEIDENASAGEFSVLI